jgi:hypothetical protein
MNYLAVGEILGPILIFALLCWWVYSYLKEKESHG